MKILKKLIFTFIICLSFTSGYSQNEGWINISTRDGVIYYVRAHDSTTMTNVKKVWIKEVHKNLKTINLKTGFADAILNGYSIKLREYDCSERKFKMISTADYYPSGKLHSTVKWEEYEQKWHDVTPDSVGKFLLEKVCELFNSSSSDL